MRILTTLLVASLTSALFTGPALAQTEPTAEPPSQGPARPSAGIEEFVVHAGESESAADFKAGDSIASFGAEDLSALGAQSVADIATFTPNLEIVTTGSTTPTFFIRGVGLNDFNANSTGAVAIYRDDVPINAPALQLSTLYDLTDVNVLFGPQGTGQARNASAGAIKVYSKKPSGRYGGFLRSEYGNYRFIDLEGAVEAPIWEDIVLGRVAFRFSQRDGYVENDCGNAPPPSERGVSENIDSTVPFDDMGRPVSICGETVQPDRISGNGGVSTIDEGLPTRVNDLGNWAARATLLFQPTLDSEWLLIGSGSRRDELTQLGQSIGVGGQVFDPACLAELEDMLGRPPTTSERNQSGCQIARVLGGPDNGDFQAREVLAREIELDPCRVLDPDGVPISSGTCLTENERFTGRNNARLVLGEELVDLDSKPRHGQYNRVGDTTNDVWGVSLKGDTVLGNSYRLTNVTAYDAYDRFSDNDLDQTPNQLFEVVTDDEGWQFVQTLNLRSDASDSFPISWDIGAWYLREVLNVEIDNFFNPSNPNKGIGGRVYEQSLHSTAAYASFEFDFWRDFTLDGGVRYNWEQKSIDYQLVLPTGDRLQKEKRTWQAPTGTVRLTYRFRPDTHAFFKYTRGWKPGTFNATSSIREGVTSADPEEIDSFEAGLSGSWFEGRLNGRFSVFHYNYTGYQIFIAQQVLGSQPEFVIVNANDAEVTGAEVTLQARPFSGTTIEANLGWLDSTFLDFVQRQQGLEQIGIFTIPIDVVTQNAGNPLLNSPTFKVNLTAEQTIPLGRFGSLTARWDGAWSDDTAYDPTGGRGLPNSDGQQFLPENTIGQSAFWLHNLRLGYRTPDGFMELALWVRNLTDATYKTFGFDVANFNQTTVYAVGLPRTYGLTLTANF